MKDYAPIANTALRLVEEFGRVATIIRYDQSEADPSKPWAGPSDPRAAPDASLSITLVGVPASGAAALGIASDLSDLVTRSERIYIVSTGAGEQTDLAEFDEVIDEGEHWKIKKVETLRPADLTLLYFIGVGR